MAQIPMILGQVIVTLILTLIRGKTLKFIIYRLLKWAVDQTDTKLDDEVVDQLRLDWELPELKSPKIVEEKKENKSDPVK